MGLDLIADTVSVQSNLLLQQAISQSKAGKDQYQVYQSKNQANKSKWHGQIWNPDLSEAEIMWDKTWKANAITKAHMEHDELQ